MRGALIEVLPGEMAASPERLEPFRREAGALDRALAAARRAVDLAPSNHVAQQALADSVYSTTFIPF